MKTPIRLAVVFVAALVVQLTVFVDVRLFGVAPELLGLVAVLAAFVGGPERGPVVAFAAGLLWDVYLPTPLGVSAITFAAAAYVVASLHEGLFRDSKWQAVAVAGSASAAIVVGYALVGGIVGEPSLVSLDLIQIAVTVGVLNAVLTPLATPVMLWAFGQGTPR